MKNTMERTILRFRTNADGEALLPGGGEVIHVQPSSGGGINIWVVCDPEAPKYKRYFHLVTTGQPVPPVGGLRSMMAITSYTDHPRAFVLEMDERSHSAHIAARKADV